MKYEDFSPIALQLVLGWVHKVDFHFLENTIFLEVRNYFHVDLLNFIQLCRTLSRKQISSKSAVDLRVKVNKFLKLGHVLPAICYDLLSS